MENLSASPRRLHFAQLPGLGLLRRSLRWSDKARLCGGLAVWALLAFAADGRASTPTNTVMYDQFLRGRTPMWYFLDTNSAGAPWNMGIADGGHSLLNSTLTTHALQQFDPITLASGQTIILTTKIMTTSNQSSSPQVFHFSLLNTTNRLEGNGFGYSPSADPLNDAAGYAYTQNYNSNLPSIYSISNDAYGTSPILTATNGITLGNGGDHTVSITMTHLSSGGMVISGSLAGTNFPYYAVTNLTPPTYTFNTVRVDGGGIPIAIDDVMVQTTTPVTTYSFTLPHAYVTSAGIYDKNGLMARELWKKLPLETGTYTQAWNNTDDNGNAATNGPYTFKVLYHNMNYEWDGVIGNTSTNYCGRSTYSSNSPPLISPYDTLETSSGMAFDSGSFGYVAFSYNEGQPSTYRFNTASPNAPVVAVAADQNTRWKYIAAADTNLYLADNSTGWDTNNCVFVQAFRTNGVPIQLTNGVTAQKSNGVKYKGVIDFTNEITPLGVDKLFVTAHAATGVAVQPDSWGNLLAVAHGGTNLPAAENNVVLYNKYTGATNSTISVVGPTAVAFSPNGTLWVTTSSTNSTNPNSLLCYSNLTTTPTLVTGSTVSGFAEPLAVGVSPASSDVVAVADAGTSQQVKFYDHTGAPLQFGSPATNTLGVAGGYPILGPDVSPYKFWFANLRSFKVPEDQTFLAFQPDGSFWVGDGGNFRALHYAGPSGTTPPAYSNQIADVPTVEAVSVDPNAPTNVYNGNLQYVVDYTKPNIAGDPDPNLGGNGSWKLVKNWFGGRTNFGVYGNFMNAVTLGTNTYALGRNTNSGQPALSRTVFWLPPTGPAQIVVAAMTNLAVAVIQPDGNFRYATHTSPGSGTNYTENIYEQPFTGMGTSNNPTWGAPTNAATIPIAFTDSSGLSGLSNQFYSEQNEPVVQAGWGMSPNIPTTSTGDYVTYQATGSSYTTNSVRYWAGAGGPVTHLGLVHAGGTNFNWIGSPGDLITEPDGLGTFSDIAEFGGHDGIAAFANGHNIVYGFDGQYGSFSSQWTHFYDDGLFVGQFGVTGGISRHLDQLGGESVPGFAGNIGTMSMVNYNGTNFVYCSDESGHSGITRWRMDGTIAELTATVTNNGTTNLGTAAAWPTTNLVSNPSFEAEAATYTESYALGYTNSPPQILPVGWQCNYGTNGTGLGAFYTEWTEVSGATNTAVFAHSLPYRATIAKSTAYTVQPYQVISGLTNGATYNFSAWVRCNGTSAAYLYCNTNPYTTFTTSMGKSITATSGAWTCITNSVVAPSSGQVEVGFHVQGNGYGSLPNNEYIDIDDVALTPQ